MSIDSDGIIVARYEYDSWGNHLYISDSEIARINPIRYRGYYWDAELELYYLQSRYYCPQLRRFISADVLLDTGVGILGTNMYIYCNNDPVNLWDPDGFSRQGVLPQLRNPFEWLEVGLDTLAGWGAAAWGTAVAGAKVVGVAAVGVLSLAGLGGEALAEAESRRFSDAARDLGRAGDVFYAATLRGREGILVEESRGAMNWQEAVAHIQAGGDVWTENAGHAWWLATALGGGALPAHGEDAGVLSGIHARHYHPGTTLGGRARVGGREPHIFYGRQAVTMR